MNTKRRLAALALTVAAVTGSALAMPAPASATPVGLCPQGTGWCGDPGLYSVSGTDGTLAIQSTWGVDHVEGWAVEGASVQVMCQVTYGSTDPYDHLYSTTWDWVDIYDSQHGKEVAGWVYDHYVTTPAQNSYGWSLTFPCGG